MDSALSTSLIIYPPSKCLTLPPTFYFFYICVSVCVGGRGRVNTRALVRGKSGADMKHVRQGSAGDATAASRKCVRSLLIHWKADIYRKPLRIYCQMLNKQWDPHSDVMLQSPLGWLYIWRTWLLPAWTLPDTGNSQRKCCKSRPTVNIRPKDFCDGGFHHPKSKTMHPLQTSMEWAAERRTAAAFGIFHR